MLDGHNYHHVFTKLILVLNPPIPAMAGGLGVLYGKDPLNLAIEDQISFAAQVGIIKMIMVMMQSLSSLVDGDDNGKVFSLMSLSFFHFL